MKQSKYNTKLVASVSLQKYLTSHYYPKAVCRHTLFQSKFFLFFDTYARSIPTYSLLNNSTFFGKSFNYVNCIYVIPGVTFERTCLFSFSKERYSFYLSGLFLTFLSTNKYKSYIILNPIKGGFFVYATFYKSFIPSVSLELLCNSIFFYTCKYTNLDLKYSYTYLVKHKSFNNPLLLSIYKFSFSRSHSTIIFTTLSNVDTFVAEERENLKLALQAPKAVVEPLFPVINASAYINWKALNTKFSNSNLFGKKFNLDLPAKYYQYFLPHIYPVIEASKEEEKIEPILTLKDFI